MTSFCVSEYRFIMEKKEKSGKKEINVFYNLTSQKQLSINFLVYVFSKVLLPFYLSMYR